ncbi:MAG: ATP-binding protein [Nanobdellota archaeon]
MVKNKYLALFFCIIIFSSLVYASSAYGEEIQREGYTISRSKVDRTVAVGTLFQDFIIINNLRNTPISATFSSNGNVMDLLEFDYSGIEILPQNTSSFYFYIKGTSVGNYSGEILISGEVDEKIIVDIEVVEEDLNPVFFIQTEPFKRYFKLTEKLKFKVYLNKIKSGEIENLTLRYYLNNTNNQSFFIGEDSFNFTNSFYLIKEFDVPPEAEKGEYILQAFAIYNGESINSLSYFVIRKPFFNQVLFGFLPVWLLFLILGTILLSLLIYLLIKRHIKRSKKYSMELDVKKLPVFSKENLSLGKIAETKVKAYLEPDKLKTHTIVAGATGGGKSIAAQVVIEEALLKNVAVIVFDPTAQWSGMLRKCEDKKMLSYYPAFGLKQTDAKAFFGNIRQISHAREIIEIEKYIHPGQIQIFALNKLDPNDMDIFVASVIRQIFKSDPKETPDLKVLLVFDEVHRLLSKFGGNGEGFLQIERACREFRKWGIGVMLVSQVLSDFVGEIKANINTEIQMRTRDEGDLGRIKIKYGEQFLQSLVKASVGVGMFVNTSYNRGKPYFINFRPILHNTRRLSDEELEKYNKYNEIIDDFDNQVEQLEKEKIDTFDLKMELKLIKDKLMTGNFSVVDIYIEGLGPRLQKQWEKIGKKPKKLEKKLIDVSEIQKSVEEAKKARELYEKEEMKKKKVEDKKIEAENIATKILKPLTFDNGIMISTLKELRETLPSLDMEIFKIHVNAKRNDISKWLEQVSQDLSKKVAAETNKSKIVLLLEEFLKTTAPKKA